MRMMGEGRNVNPCLRLHCLPLAFFPCLITLHFIHAFFGLRYFVTYLIWAYGYPRIYAAVIKAILQTRKLRSRDVGQFDEDHKQIIDRMVTRLWAVSQWPPRLPSLEAIQEANGKQTFLQQHNKSFYKKHPWAHSRLNQSCTQPQELRRSKTTNIINFSLDFHYESINKQAHPSNPRPMSSTETLNLCL